MSFRPDEGSDYSSVEITMREPLRYEWEMRSQVVEEILAGLEEGMVIRHEELGAVGLRDGFDVPEPDDKGQRVIPVSTENQGDGRMVVDAPSFRQKVESFVGKGLWQGVAVLVPNKYS